MNEFCEVGKEKKNVFERLSKHEQYVFTGEPADAVLGRKVVRKHGGKYVFQLIFPAKCENFLYLGIYLFK